MKTSVTLCIKCTLMVIINRSHQPKSKDPKNMKWKIHFREINGLIRNTKSPTKTAFRKIIRKWKSSAETDKFLNSTRNSLVHVVDCVPGRESIMLVGSMVLYNLDIVVTTSLVLCKYWVKGVAHPIWNRLGINTLRLDGDCHKLRDVMLRTERLQHSIDIDSFRRRPLLQRLLVTCKDITKIYNNKLNEWMND